ncbi:MAG: metallophosphoesterase family protein [Wenzhouxiangella sp.]
MTTLLAIGDIHLGRLPAALPDELKNRQRELGPETAWMRSVTEAVDRKVDAVLLAGDVVERSRDFFVAYGQLKAGVEKLAAAGIPVIAVAGNHDTHVLPRLAAEIDSLHLLGEGGYWQQHTVNGCIVIGWSFPQAQVRHNPLDSFPKLSPRKPLIGLLHCDRDQSDSPYAPVSSADLEEAPVAAWLLGHIHQPDALDGSRPMGYLGSVSALRASETGSRGPWLVEVSRKSVSAEQLTLAPLRYEMLEIDCSELDSAGDLGGLILAACRRALGTMERHPDALGLRVVLTGQCAISGHLPAAAESLLSEARPWQETGVQCFIHRISVHTLPRLDLDSLARQSDPCGLLAQRLLALKTPASPEWQRLVDMGRASLQAIADAREFRELDRKLSDDDIAERLESAAQLTLSKLISQREKAG